MKAEIPAVREVRFDLADGEVVGAEFPYEKQLEHILGVEIMAAMAHLKAPYRGIIKQDVKQFCHDVRWNILSRPRARLESSTDELHFIPYGTVTKPSLDKVLTYKRPDKDNGESRLAGRRSVGFAGHVDRPDFKGCAKGSVYPFQTLVKSFLSEMDQELKYYCRGEQISMETHPSLFVLKVVGFIYDMSDDVGKTHLGVYFNLEVDAEVFIESGEPDQIQDLRWEVSKSPGLLAQYGLYENWSKFIIEEDHRPTTQQELDDYRVQLNAYTQS